MLYSRAKTPAQIPLRVSAWLSYALLQLWYRAASRRQTAASVASTRQRSCSFECRNISFISRVQFSSSRLCCRSCRFWRSAKLVMEVSIVSQQVVWFYVISFCVRFSPLFPVLAAGNHLLRLGLEEAAVAHRCSSSSSSSSNNNNNSSSSSSNNNSIKFAAFLLL